MLLEKTNQRHSQKNMKKGWRQWGTHIFSWSRDRGEQIGRFFHRGIKSLGHRYQSWHFKALWPKKAPKVQLDEKRRALLKYALFGGGLFLVGKYMNPLMNTLQGDAVVDEKVFRNFTLTETGRQLQVTDDEGNEILTIDKESF